MFGTECFNYQIESKTNLKNASMPWKEKNYLEREKVCFFSICSTRAFLMKMSSSLF